MTPTILWCALAWAAGPDAPFARVDESTRVRRYNRVTSDPPVRAWWRKRSGPFEVWLFKDGIIEHYRRYEKRKVVSVHRFDSAGMPLTTVAMNEEEAPATVTVHALPEQTIDVSAWTGWTAHGLQFRLPAQPGSSTETTATWTLPQGELSMDRATGNPFDDAFGEQLAVGCGCRLIDRATVWIDGRAAARYRVRIPDVEAPEEGHVWALPLTDEPEGDVLLMLWMVADDDERDAHLALGRAMMALVTKEAP